MLVSSRAGNYRVAVASQGHHIDTAENARTGSGVLMDSLHQVRHWIGNPSHPHTYMQTRYLKDTQISSAKSPGRLHFVL